MSGFDQLKLQRSATKIIAARDQRITELEEALRPFSMTHVEYSYPRKSPMRDAVVHAREVLEK